MNFCSKAVSVCLVSLLLGGCATGGKIFAKKTNAAEVPPPPKDGPMPVLPSVPYQLTARCAGPCIDFEITNNGPGNLLVSPDNFAMIPRGTRRVVPYDSQSATIDCPSNVAAGQTVSGRAVFKEFGSPVGDRLVFKPDGQGTFAVIGGTTGATSAAFNKHAAP
jgi:hypothetical protein